MGKARPRKARMGKARPRHAWQCRPRHAWQCRPRHALVRQWPQYASGLSTLVASVR